MDRFIFSGHHCPNCGSESLWEDSTVDDYYVGSLFVCYDCKSGSYISQTMVPLYGNTLQELAEHLNKLKKDRLCPH